MRSGTPAHVRHEHHCYVFPVTVCTCKTWGSRSGREARHNTGKKEGKYSRRDFRGTVCIIISKRYTEGVPQDLLHVLSLQFNFSLTSELLCLYVCKVFCFVFGFALICMPMFDLGDDIYYSEMSFFLGGGWGGSFFIFMFSYVLVCLLVVTLFFNSWILHSFIHPFFHLFFSLVLYSFSLCPEVHLGSRGDVKI